jgi:tetraacyldisaccharide 4'-kinase
VLDSHTFHDIVSGRRRGVIAALMRGLLRLAKTPYSLAVRFRNHRFDRGRGVRRVAVPVVSVGNLTLGGTGKTPMVEFLARWFRDHDLRVTIVSRGYGAEAGSRNDEALELEQKLPDVPHLQNPDRVAAAETAIEEFETELILLDDGFQHRRIARDLDLVMIDALEPDGLGHVFPRGTLREPLAGLARADVVALSRADMVDVAERQRIRERLQPYAASASWIEVAHRPVGFLSSTGETALISSLSGCNVAAVCGIGNPQAFRHTIDTCGMNVAAMREFADHHNYTREDVQSLSDWADQLEVTAILCTHKDLVKLRIDQLGGKPLWALSIRLEILSGREALENKLNQMIAGTDQ